MLCEFMTSQSLWPKKILFINDGTTEFRKANFGIVNDRKTCSKKCDDYVQNAIDFLSQEYIDKEKAASDAFHATPEGSE